MRRTGTGATPPPETAGGAAASPQPDTFRITARMLPGFTSSLGASISLIPNCIKPTILNGVQKRLPRGQSPIGTVTTESLRLISVAVRSAGLGLLPPPSIVTGTEELSIAS